MTALYIFAGLVVLACFACLLAGVLIAHLKDRRLERQQDRDLERDRHQLPAVVITNRNHPLATIGGFERWDRQGGSSV